MFESRVLASVIAGIPISLVCLGYVAVRRDEVVRLFSEGGSDALDPRAATALALVAAVSVGPGLGLAAGFVQSWLPSQESYLAVAVALAVLLSLAAIATRTPMMVEKLVLNGAVMFALGFVAPRLVAD